MGPVVAKSVQSGGPSLRWPEAENDLFSRNPDGRDERRRRFPEVLERASRRPGELSKEDVLVLLEGSEDEQNREALFRAAAAVRERYLGDEVHLRGIIEFSNHCVNLCHYCGLRAANTTLKRYRMSRDEIVAAAEKARSLGIPTIVLQSGEDPAFSAEEVALLVRLIKERTGGAITLSVGERPPGDYQLWREAGADRYLLKHETADPRLFARLRPGKTLQERLGCLCHLRKLGYQVGSGNMVGLPGQTLETLAEDIMLLKELDVEMAGIGPFIPHPGTPLAGARPGSPELTLRVLAVARLVLPLAHLPATTALATADPRGRLKALSCGANVIMPNVGPERYRQFYEIYPGKAGVAATPEESVRLAKETIALAGARVARGPGHSPKPQFAQGGSGIPTAGNLL